MERIQNLLETKSFYDNSPGVVNKNSFDNQIEIKNLNFSFDDKQAILKNIKLHIKKGQKVAFIGQSGSGKTTLANLISGIYPAPKESIFIDGTEVNTINHKDYSKLFSIVTQDPILFYGTIKENLLLASENADDNTLEKALKQANALGFVSQLPNGIDTEIGERGQQLSIGQQQRITLARAYLKDAPILILDEITASVDNISSKKIKEALIQINKEKTIIIITHKLEAVTDYDKIFLFDKGQIVAEGTHGELLRDTTLYQKIYSV